MRLRARVTTFALRIIGAVVAFVLKKLGIESCDKCSARFQLLLEKLGFIVCYDDGYVIPVAGFDCRESPFKITWDEVKSHHTEATFTALRMAAEFTDPEFMAEVVAGLQKKKEESEWQEMATVAGGPLRLRGRIIPVVQQETWGGRIYDFDK